MKKTQKKQFILNSFVKTAMIFTIAVLMVFFIPYVAYSGTNNANDETHSMSSDEFTPESGMEEIIHYQITQVEGRVSSVQQWIDISLSKQAGQSADWYMIALKQMGSEADFSSYLRELQQFVLSAPNDNTSALKLSLALVMMGDSDNSFIGDSVNNSIDEENIMSLIYGLHLYNNGVTEGKLSRQEILDAIISMRLADGGWAIMGETSDVDVTAMTLQALIPNAAEGGEIDDLIKDTVELLSRMQLKDGGYKSFDQANPESACQVIIALCAAGIDPCEDSRFIKNDRNLLDVIDDFKVESGAYTHILGDEKVNGTTTVQVFMALDALHRLRANRGSIYVVDNEPWENCGISEKFENSTNYISPLKLRIIIVIAGLVLLVCVILTILGKRNIKNYIFAIAIGIVLIVVVFFLRLSTVEEYYSLAVDKRETTGKVSITIRCDNLVGMADNEYIPADGVILPVTDYDLHEGDTVYDILVEAAKTEHIQMENTGYDGNVHGSVYIAGINYLYEQQYGMLSGWIYRVNGIAPSVGCGDYVLKDGDEIEWLYTLELGHDLD